MAKKYDHIHKYMRTTIGHSDYIVYRCMVENCTHYLEPSLVVNKETQCWGGCGGTLIITQEHVGKLIQRPRCRPCIDAHKEAIMENQLANQMPAREE